MQLAPSQILSGFFRYRDIGIYYNGQVNLTKLLKFHCRDPIPVSRPSSMAEHPAVVNALRGDGNQAMSRHRRVPGSTPGGGTILNIEFF